ncbi:M57 family metalloprotease [Myxococcus sp. MxC21-1]|uniref:M57 family metalloprotease n=1 Tax=Myxococcus sp. MxC21-1 TaxID=3041439 RepID=UPI00292CBBBD|nr:M57 family metalloprotease [Myxococcus sp. MxC21-1]WNZ63948.1 M57 family metalloprotease [Myxococcus sp. MxC21-1]
MVGCQVTGPASLANTSIDARDAIHVPGTPTTTTAGGSLMNSCFPAGTTGEFSSSDITTLTTLYGQE